MKIKALTGTNASGKSLEAGKVYEVSEKDAKILIQMKKAEAHNEIPADEEPSSDEGEIFETKKRRWRR